MPKTCRSSPRPGPQPRQSIRSEQLSAVRTGSTWPLIPESSGRGRRSQSNPAATTAISARAVCGLPLYGREAHDVRMGRDVRADDLFSRGHRVRVAHSVDVIGLDQILLIRGLRSRRSPRPGTPERMRRSRCTLQDECRASWPANSGSSLRGWIQSTGHTSTQAVSFVSMQGSVMMKGTTSFSNAEMGSVSRVDCPVFTRMVRATMRPGLTAHFAAGRGIEYEPCWSFELINAAA